ncbi:MAG: hypothetical protein IKX13_09150, partial [Bacteroidales bacterium]|nr:hypothetical protein [Bacteroidales bacterium]
TWRAISGPEWDYLINSRSTASGIRYAKASVNGVPGLVIVPDNWSSTIYSLDSTNTTNATFNSNVITAAQWGTLEDAGCVFLPAAGRRSGTSVLYAGSYGYYWSSSCNSYGNVGYGYFYSKYVSALYLSRNAGYSVRLVRPAN